MQNLGRPSVLLATLFVIEDTILLNLMFLSLLPVFNLSFSTAAYLSLILINLGYLLSFSALRFKFDDVSELHISNLIRRKFYKLAIAALILITCLFLFKFSGTASRLYVLEIGRASCRERV